MDRVSLDGAALRAFWPHRRKIQILVAKNVAACCGWYIFLLAGAAPPRFGGGQLILTACRGGDRLCSDLLDPRNNFFPCSRVELANAGTNCQQRHIDAADRDFRNLRGNDLSRSEASS